MSYFVRDSLFSRGPVEKVLKLCDAAWKNNARDLFSLNIVKGLFRVVLSAVALPKYSTTLHA
jgi:hypothetical protein